MSAGDEYQSGRILRAYHKAGHAIVGHVIGRCIEEVSIAMGYDGYGGYCRFNTLIEDANDHPEWRDDLGNPDLVTIYYAGMLATAYACAPYVTYYEDESCVEYPEGSERDDLEQIHEILTPGSTNSSAKRSRMQVGCTLKRFFQSIGLPWTRWLRRYSRASCKSVHVCSFSAISLQNLCASSISPPPASSRALQEASELRISCAGSIVVIG
jgi:hypothetical protein